MATSTGFRQQCPSCEAMVPVRDSSFIGKKIDCPKCKYRFVVEEPEVEEDDRDEAPQRGGRGDKKSANGKAASAKSGKGRRDDDDAPRGKKKKTGPSTTLVLGVGLGALGVVVLVILGLWMGGVFGGDETPTTTSTTPSGPPAGMNNNQQKAPADNTQAAAPVAVAFAGKDPTNLLLNDSNIVLRLNLSASSGSGVNRSMFESPGSFSPTAFREHFGFGVGEVDTALRAINARNRTHFNVIRTKHDIRKGDLEQRLGLKAEAPINGLAYYTITSDMDSFSSYLFQEEPKNRKDTPAPLTLHYADDRTLIIAHQSAMKSFLDAKGTPANLSQPPAATGGGQRGGQGGQPGAGMMGAGGGMMGPGMMGGQGGGQPGGGMMGAGGGMMGQQGGGPPGGGQAGGGPPGRGQGGGGPPAGGAAPGGGQPGGAPAPGGGAAGGGAGPQNPGVGAPGGGVGAAPGGGGMGMMGGPGMGMMGGPGGGMMGGPGGQNNPPASSSYLTIVPRLKAIMDAVEVGKETTLVSFCVDKEADQGMLRYHDSVVALLPPLLDIRGTNAPIETSALGLSIQALRPNRLTFVFAQFIKDAETARSLTQASRTSLEQQAAVILKLAYGIDVQLGSQQGGGGMAAGGNQGMGMMGGGPGMMGGGPGMMGGGPGMMGGGPGMMGGGPGMGGGAGQRGGAGAGGGAQPPGGGAGPGMMGGGPGMMGGGPGMMGGGPGMMGGGPGMGGGAGMRGGGPGGGRPGAGGGGQNAPQQDVSTVTVTQKDNTVSLRVDVILTESVYGQITGDLQTKLSVIKGESEMIGVRSKVHELAAALSELVKRRGKFPMGAHERRVGPDRLGEPYPPDQRVSWMAELLPYLGSGEYKELYNQVVGEKSWRDSDNQVAASALVSHFLNPWSSRSNWWVPYSSTGKPVAATHFVGIAGIGLDAAEYSREDKSVADKIGVFHYDWQTSFSDLKKPEATIAVMQVPYEEFKTPWMAGGGSTVRGVAEDTGVEPFVCESYTFKDGTQRAGTFAIMANGDVRFIPRDIPKDVFLKMCSVNLAERVDNVDEYAPLVPAPKPKAKPVLPPVLPEPKSGPEKRNPDPPKTGAPGGAASKAMTALSNNCARCHTGARAKGKNMMFNDDGSLNLNVSKEAISKALADGKMPPKGQPRPSDDDMAAIQAWLKGG